MAVPVEAGDVTVRKGQAARSGGPMSRHGVRSKAVAAFACLALSLIAAPPALATPTWLAPVNLSEAGQGAFAPQVASDAQGDAVAVWQRFNGSNEIIQAATKPAGGSWQAPVNLSDAGQSAFAPQVASDAQGDA